MSFNPGRFKLSIRVGEFVLWHYLPTTKETFADIVHADGTYFVESYESIEAGDNICVEARDGHGEVGARLYRVTSSCKAGVTLRRLTHT